MTSKITKENAPKFIDEARDTTTRARDYKEYEAMLIDMLKAEFEGKE